MIQAAYKDGYRRAVREMKEWIERSQETFTDRELLVLKEQVCKMEKDAEYVGLQEISG